MNKQSSRFSDSGGTAEFDALLRSAKAQTPLPGAFQAEVWRRIAAAQDASFSRRVSRWMEHALGVLVQPVAAAAAVVTMVSAGVLFGSMTESRTRDGRVAYIESVNPFAQSHSGENQ